MKKKRKKHQKMTLYRCLCCTPRYLIANEPLLFLFCCVIPFALVVVFFFISLQLLLFHNLMVLHNAWISNISRWNSFLCLYVSGIYSMILWELRFVASVVNFLFESSDNLYYRSLIGWWFYRWNECFAIAQLGFNNTSC